MYVDFVDFFLYNSALFRLFRFVMTSFPRRNAKLEVDRDIMKRQAGLNTAKLPRKLPETFGMQVYHGGLILLLSRKQIVALVLKAGMYLF